MKKMNILFILLPAVLLIVFLVACGGPLTVGDGIKLEQISDFYYTVSTSTNPPFFQRYRVVTEDGVHTFYHEKREGDHWPLTENDVTISGRKELSPDEWTQFCKCIEGGTVTERKEETSTGGSGPGLYIYWDGDKGTKQVFAFRDLDAQYDFRKFCEDMTAASVPQ